MSELEIGVLLLVATIVVLCSGVSIAFAFLAIFGVITIVGHLASILSSSKLRA